MTADLVIRNGLIVDGSGGPPRRADIAIEGDRIIEVGDDDRPGSARAGCRRAARHAGVRRSPHPLRRPGDVGSAAGAVVASRGDDGGHG